MQQTVIAEAFTYSQINGILNINDFFRVRSLVFKDIVYNLQHLVCGYVGATTARVMDQISLMSAFI
jgi:hypothetical protein